MKRVLTIAVLGGIVGLVAGYFVFGSIAGSRVGVEALLSFGGGGGIGGTLRQAAQQIAGIDEIRRNILLTGAIAAGVAAFAAVVGGAGSRRRR